MINIHARYAIFEDLNDLISESVLNSLKTLLKKVKIKSLELDEEKSFVSNKEFNFHDNQNIDYYILTEQEHQSLGIIVQFRRTYGDWIKMMHELIIIR
jgi:hypothetical protein